MSTATKVLALLIATVAVLYVFYIIVFPVVPLSVLNVTPLSRIDGVPTPDVGTLTFEIENSAPDIAGAVRVIVSLSGPVNASLPQNIFEIGDIGISPAPATKANVVIPMVTPGGAMAQTVFNVRLDVTYVDGATGQPRSLFRCWNSDPNVAFPFTPLPAPCS